MRKINNLKKDERIIRAIGIKENRVRKQKPRKESKENEAEGERKQKKEKKKWGKWWKEEGNEEKIRPSLELGVRELDYINEGRVKT